MPVRVTGGSSARKGRILAVVVLLDELGFERSTHEPGKPRTRGYAFEPTGTESVKVYYYDPESGPKAEERQRRFSDLAGPHLNQAFRGRVTAYIRRYGKGFEIRPS